MTLAQVILTAVLGSIAELIFLIVSLVDAVCALVNVKATETLCVLEAYEIKFIHWLSVCLDTSILG